MGRLHVCQTIIQIPRSLSNPIWFVSFHRVLDSSVTRIWDLVVPTKVLWRVPRSLKLCNYSLSKGATPEARCNTITGCVDLNGRSEVCAAFTRERGSSVLLHNYITVGDLVHGAYAPCIASAPFIIWNFALLEIRHEISSFCCCVSLRATLPCTVVLTPHTLVWPEKNYGHARHPILIYSCSAMTSFWPNM